MYRLRTIGLAAVLTIIVAACSSSASSSPTVAPTVSTAPTLGATPSAAATGSESAIPSIDLPNSAPELLALLPDKVGDVASFPQAQVSMNGKDFIAQGGDQGNQEFVDFLQRLGASADDVTVASKTYADLANASGEATAIFAFRVAGADSSKLLAEMQTAIASGEDNVTWQAATLGGKSVQVAATSQMAGGQTYVYVRSEIVFAVITSDDALAEDALSQLP
ncbi:MAG TPA: hypothetical protein VFJ13_10985 [Paracoccaceae bacterium]|nr:hypothetical protein [Paracoccaceae bacterium]